VTVRTAKSYYFCIMFITTWHYSRAVQWPCVHLSVCLFVTSWFRMAKCTIMQTMPHSSPGR